MNSNSLFSPILAAAILHCCSLNSLALDDSFFEKKVRPILVKRCFRCHSGVKNGGGLSLESKSGWQKGGSSGAAIIPGNVDESLFIQAINYDTLEMPPDDAGGKLKENEIAILTEWVEKGAFDPRESHVETERMTRKQSGSWWSFQPILSSNSELDSKQIDLLILEKNRQKKLQLTQQADRRTLLRRATYDLIGLPPTQSEVDLFLNDDSEDAFAKVVDRLLASREYGAKWGRHWLDVVRYADTAGENTDRPLPHAWRYRNWVIDSFNDDRPFDEFALHQIAGDLVANRSSESDRQQGVIATGFLSIARRFGHDIDKDIHLMFEDVIDNVGKNFLGLTIGCARCHDHKYDPITAKDYYSLYGVFSSSKFSFPGCEPKGQPRDLVSLFSKEKHALLEKEYQSRLKKWTETYEAPASESARLKQLSDTRSRVLASSNVGEGKKIDLEKVPNHKLNKIKIDKGEVILLTVAPNGGHGADTTRVDLVIGELASGKEWKTDELIDEFAGNGPSVKIRDAVWCFMDVESGPTLLKDKKANLNNVVGLHAWSLGDTPSMVVNSNKHPVSVWTTLPPRTFFVHPGPKRSVGLAWICPKNGVYAISGTIADGHPAPGLDGVSFRIEHVHSDNYGVGLERLANLASKSKAPKPVAPQVPVAYAVVEGEVADARVQLRGDPQLPGDVVPRRWLSVFGGQKIGSSKTSGRTELAKHIIEHPLFARVFVNRVWQLHFGRGLVATPNDFGFRGSPPTHPELLDALASQFINNGYRIKSLHRLIMLTEAYQRNSQLGNAAAEIDPNNLWLSRYSNRRLTAEEIRDTLLFVSGNLDLTPAQQHPFPSESSWTFTQHAPFNAVYPTSKRSVFLMVQRQRRHPFLALFDGPDPNASTPSRDATTVPSQALFFLNDPFFHEQAKSLGIRLMEFPLSSRLAKLYSRLFQRKPTNKEIAVANQILESSNRSELEKWTSLCRILMSTNEFIYID